MQGLVHIYTGNGKGKTTAAVGLGIRAYGRGMRVLMIQFLKGSDTGELKTAEILGPRFKIQRTKDVKGFIWNMNEEQKAELKKSMEVLLESSVQAASSGEWDMLILDEVMGAISNALVSVEDIARLIRNKPQSLEVVMTGRNAPDMLVELADYVSEISPVKHPFEKGIGARKGIEF